MEAMGGSRAEFHALWLAASSSSSDDDAAPAPSPGIAGRRAELAVVRDHLDGHGGLLVVTGEAGIGKSTLVDAAAVLTETRVAVGRCLPLSTDVPLMPVVELLRSIHDADEGRWIGEALSDCPAYAREALARLLPELGAAAASTDDVDFAQQHLYAAVAAVLARLAATRPLAVVVEDLHVSDATTLDLLEYVLSRDVDVPVTVTWRLDHQRVQRWRSEWLARVQALPGVRTMSLGPLTLEETRDQLRLAGWLDGTTTRPRPADPRAVTRAPPLHRAPRDPGRRPDPPTGCWPTSWTGASATSHPTRAGWPPRSAWPTGRSASSWWPPPPASTTTLCSTRCDTSRRGTW